MGLFGFSQKRDWKAAKEVLDNRGQPVRIPDVGRRQRVAELLKQGGEKVTVNGTTVKVEKKRQ